MSAARGSQPSLRLTVSTFVDEVGPVPAGVRPKACSDRTDEPVPTRVPLRLRRVEEDEAAPTLVEILKRARQAVLSTYGPCAATTPALITAWARRLAETTPMPLADRLAIFGELARFADTGPTSDERGVRIGC